MSDRNTVRKELDLDTDSVLSGNDNQSIRDFYYSMRECLLTHDNPSVQNKSYLSLKPVNLKPFYIKPYLTQESKIKFADAEMEKLRKMGILHRGSSEFRSPIMLIKKSHSSTKLDLKHTSYSINLTEKSKQYTSCYASPGSNTYQYNKLCQGLNVSPTYFTSLMNDLLHELPSDIHEYIDCLMDDVIVFTPDIKTHKKVIKSFMYMLKKYGMLLTINKIHTFGSIVRYMGLLLSRKDNLPTITPLASCIKAISALSVPITARGIKSFIGCVIYLAQFLPKLSELIKPINDILRKCNKVDKSDFYSATMPESATRYLSSVKVLHLYCSHGP